MSYRLGFLVVALTVLFAGCERPLGYGVLYWNQSVPGLANGEVLVLLEESRLNDTYLARPLGAQAKELLVPRAMVRRVANESAAVSLAEEYKEVADLFAQNGRDAGLYVRERPDGRAQQVYRLRPQEVAKVMEPPGAETEVGQYRGHWYRVLTTAGVSGFVFDIYLRVYRQNSDGEQTILKDLERKQIVNQFPLDVLGGKIWHEDQMIERLKGGRLGDRASFVNHYFSLDVEQEKVSYHFPPLEVDEEYGGVVNLADSRYQLDGVGIIIDIFNPWRIGLRVTTADGETVLTLVNMPPDKLEQLLDQVWMRDWEHLLSFLSRGLQLRSERYGRVGLVASGRFSWDGHQQLIAEGVIAAGAVPTGQVDFPYRPDDALVSDYDGVITFTFDGTGSEVSFLYKMGTDTVRMRVVPSVAVEDGIVNHDYLLYNPGATFTFSGPRYLPEDEGPLEPDFSADFVPQETAPE